MKEILVIGTNAVWQKLLVFDDFEKNRINRANSMIKFASGKGVNFARATKNYQCYNPNIIHFTGGTNGQLLNNDLSRENIKFNNISIIEETRGATTCIGLNNQSTTEIIEPTPNAQEIDIQKFEQLAQEMIAKDKIIAISICGTLIGGATTNCYTNIFKTAEKYNKTILVDSYKDMHDIFLTVKNRIILKLNAKEICELMHIDDVYKAMTEAKNLYNLKFVAVTNEDKVAILLDSKNKFYHYKLPKLDKIISPIGAGDTASAILLSKYLKSNDELQSFKMALAAASSSCMSFKGGDFDYEFMLKYSEQIEIF